MNSVLTIAPNHAVQNACNKARSRVRLFPSTRRGTSKQKVVKGKARVIEEINKQLSNLRCTALKRTTKIKE
jgi:hypothetical protein